MFFICSAEEWKRVYEWHGCPMCVCLRASNSISANCIMTPVSGIGTSKKKSILGMCVSVYVCQHRFIEQNERCSLNAAPFSVFLRIFSCALCILVGKARSGNFESQFPPLSRFPLSSNIQTTRNKCENWVEDSRKEDTFK